MNFFDLLTLFGGLAMFLYGMRLMGDGLKEGSSGGLKTAMESVTNNSFKAFLLGLIMTAVIQSSTATIVITSGLVGAGILTLDQSLGIIVGANVGTTVTGQIIRLLDVDASGASWLQIFKPSSLAPIALILGIFVIMGGKKLKNQKTIGAVAMGFGILFTGLMSMTSAVSALTETGIFETVFSGLGNNPLLGYIAGAGVAFILQSSSATIGILQALSASGLLTFKAIYAIIVGVYLGDCVTTAIVCSIGARAEAKRVGVVNILYNLSKSVLVLVAVNILHLTGALNWIWDSVANSSVIANTNTVFNLACALLLLPGIKAFRAAAHRIVPDETVPENKYKDKLDSMNAKFFETPAIALNSCYEVLGTMLDAARSNLDKAFSLLSEYDEAVYQDVMEEEENIDALTDRLSHYLVELSPNLSLPNHVAILDQYYKIVVEFERLGDHAVNIAKGAQSLSKDKLEYSKGALAELTETWKLVHEMLDCSEASFRDHDLKATTRIEPLTEVGDDMIETMRSHHLKRMVNGQCNVFVDANFTNLLIDLGRIGAICSNIGYATLVRDNPELADHMHEYSSKLHSGQDENYNRVYTEAHDAYLSALKEAKKASKSEKPDKIQKVEKNVKPEKGKSGKSDKSDKKKK